MNIEDIAGRLTVSVEEAADLLGIGRTSAYQAARDGQIPTLKIGRRILVPVPELLALVGVPYYAARYPKVRQAFREGAGDR